LKIVVTPERRPSSPTSILPPNRQALSCIAAVSACNVVAAMKRYLDKEQVDVLLNEMAFQPDARRSN